MLFLLHFGLLAKANMASPIREGTKTSSAISSKDIDILSEKIFIKIDPNFKTARFIVEYNIQSNLSGAQIPLLFYAENFKDSFYVWLNNKKINIQNVPHTYYENSLFNGFTKPLDNEKITIYWENNAGNVYKLNDLKYFEADLEKGVQKVRVEYTANVWIDLSGLIKKYSFLYSLSPAKYWKSFGSLEIIVEQEGQVKQFKTNLGLPNEETLKSLNTWTFNKIPNEYFEISYIPKPNNLASILMKIEPFGLAMLASILLAIAHFVLTITFRRKNIQKKYSLPVILGSILVPFFSLLIYNYSYVVIDKVIGDDASQYHGYVFLSYIFYPIMLIIYWIIFWQIDRQYKRRLFIGKRQ